MAPDKAPVKAGELLPLQRPSDLAHAGARMQPERDDRVGDLANLFPQV